jgi:hypothetical protein
MMNARDFVRFGILAAGLAVGAAVAATPGIASADGLDFQISIDGYDLLPTTDNSATAVSGTGDIAIAYGVNASAEANGGTGDFAEAIGTQAQAYSGYFSGSNDDSAIGIGDDSMAVAVNGSNDIAFGDSDGATVYGGGGYLPGVTGSDDIAAIVNPSGTGGYLEVGQNGNYDLGAILFDNDTIAYSATGGNYLYDIVSPLGDESGAAAATGGGWLADLLALF